MTNFKTILVAGIVGGLVMTSGLVKADQVIFSQYDGVNTWNNVYVEVDNALDFVKPGVGFAEAFAGSETQAVAPVAAVQRVDRKVTVDFMITSHDYKAKFVFTEALSGRAEYTLFTNNMVTASGVYTEAGMEAKIISDVPSFATNVVRTNVDGVEAVAEVKEVKPSWEQSLPARAIVAVDTGVDMEAFIKDFMK